MLTALAKDPGLNPHTHTVAHKPRQLWYMTPSSDLFGHRYAHNTGTYMQAKHQQKKLFKKTDIVENAF